MKTAVSVLQELMLKFRETPEYDCVAQTGPQHQAAFEYRCRARGHVSKAVARSKKEAKQEVARAMLQALAARGVDVPPPYGVGGASAVAGPSGAGEACALPGASAPDVRSYVALLRELCEEYKLPAVDYELVGDTGPPHMRQFTVRASVGSHYRLATATQKKTARQLASEALYNYLRENLKLTNGFVEEEALVRAHEKAMERYRETRTEHALRPDLSQRPADFHLGLQHQFEESMRSLALDALECSAAQAGEVALGCALGALELEAMWETLQRYDLPPLHVLSITPTAPQLTFVGDTRDKAALDAVDYLQLMLPTFPTPPTTTTRATAAATSA